MDNPAPFLNEDTWNYFWHPVCTLTELQSGAEDLGAIKNRGRIMQVKLLGRKLVVAELADGEVTVLDDRCGHRSSALSCGWVENDKIRCAYHGWVYDRNGKCVEIPSMPDMAIPEKAKVASHEVEVKYDLVWVRLDSSIDSKIPVLRSWDNENMKCVQGTPYEWATSGPRRMENFIDPTHFAFVHDGSLGTREYPLVPNPKIDTLLGELRWKYQPENRFGTSPNQRLFDLTAPLDTADYRAYMPFGVSLLQTLKNGSSNEIWVCASPLDSQHVRNFWFTCRSDDHEGDDAYYAGVQSHILSEDAPVVLSQAPPELPADPRMEMSVPSDGVLIAYRRRLKELSNAFEKGGAGALEVAHRGTCHQFFRNT